ncbi:hypothetical protein BH20ACI4_BH20ACI4_32540 [soil metagenome]
MSQVLEQDVTQSDEFYKNEIHRMVEQMQRNNEIIERDQEEINQLKMKSRETLKRIDENLAKIEATLN